MVQYDCDGQTPDLVWLSCYESGIEKPWYWYNMSNVYIEWLAIQYHNCSVAKLYVGISLLDIFHLNNTLSFKYTDLSYPGVKIGGCTIPQKRPVMSVCLSHLKKCDKSSFEQPEQQIRAILWIAFCKYYNYVIQQSIILA
jgi:hypothetical protein